MKQFSSPMPTIIWVIDNDFEQRYYRSPATLAEAIYNGYYRPGDSQLFAYRRVDGVETPGQIDMRPILATMQADKSELDRLWDVCCAAYRANGNKKVPAAEKSFKEWQKQTRDKIRAIIERSLP